MGKPTICLGKNKNADQLGGNREADQRIVFAKWIVQSPFFLLPKLVSSCSCSNMIIAVSSIEKYREDNSFKS